jgi:hypothetical protein
MRSRPCCGDPLSKLEPLLPRLAAVIVEAADPVLRHSIPLAPRSPAGDLESTRSLDREVIEYSHDGPFEAVVGDPLVQDERLQAQFVEK